jgi:mRNA-degrading endonuclease toxin of MazEF toxin-antitoxin module
MRPACVVSGNTFNAHMPVVTVAAVTSKVKGWQVAVKLPPGKPLQLESEVLPFQLVSVDKSRLGGCAGSLDAEQIEDLKTKLALSWEL